MDDMIKQKLMLKLEPQFIKQREGAFKKKLDYLETWYIIQQANEIFGFDGWSTETIRLDHIGTILGKDKNGNDRYTCAYRSTVRVTVGTSIREGSGFGNGFGKDELEAHELALKEAESDALKRAFMKFGNQFGLALYDKTRAGVGKNFKTGAERKTSGTEILGAMEACENLDELEQVRKDYTIDINRFKAGNEQDRHFFQQIVERGTSLKATFSQQAEFRQRA